MTPYFAPVRRLKATPARKPLSEAQTQAAIKARLKAEDAATMRPTRPVKKSAT